MEKKIRNSLIIIVLLVVILGIGLALVKREGLAEYGLSKGKIAPEEKRQ